MQARIDASGRIVIPKHLRDRLGLNAGTDVEIVERDGVVELRPPTTPVALIERDGGAVAVPGVDLPPLTAEMVRYALEQTRR